MREHGAHALHHCLRGLTPAPESRAAVVPSSRGGPDSGPRARWPRWPSHLLPSASPGTAHPCRPQPDAMAPPVSGCLPLVGGCGFQASGSLWQQHGTAPSTSSSAPAGRARPPPALPPATQRASRRGRRRRRPAAEQCGRPRGPAPARAFPQGRAPRLRGGRALLPAARSPRERGAREAAAGSPSSTRDRSRSSGPGRPPASPRGIGRPRGPPHGVVTGWGERANSPFPVLSSLRRVNSLGCGSCGAAWGRPRRARRISGTTA